jgi:hypothetical protein
MNRTDETSKTNGHTPRPWYRQFWPWFVIAIPTWGVMSSVITATVAIRGADEVLTQPVRPALSRTSWREGMTPGEVRAVLDDAGPVAPPVQHDPAGGSPPS